MNSPRTAFLALGFTLLTLVSCQNSVLTKWMPPREGEIKLTTIVAPVSMREGESAQILINFRSLGEPVVKKACFRWASAQPTVGMPAAYCYESEAWPATEAPLGQNCSAQANQSGEFAVVSPYVCADPKNIDYDYNGRGGGSFTATFTPAKLSVFDKYLECYAEYLDNSVVKESNKVFVGVDTTTR
jgi:hypothetical protein